MRRFPMSVQVGCAHQHNWPTDPVAFRDFIARRVKSTDMVHLQKAFDPTGEPESPAFRDFDRIGIEVSRVRSSAVRLTADSDYSGG